MTTEKLLADIRALIEAWEDCRSPKCLYVEVVFNRPGDDDVLDQYEWDGEWCHCEARFIEDDSSDKGNR